MSERKECDRQAARQAIRDGLETKRQVTEKLERAYPAAMERIMNAFPKKGELMVIATTAQGTLRQIMEADCGLTLFLFAYAAEPFLTTCRIQFTEYYYEPAPTVASVHRYSQDVPASYPRIDGTRCIAWTEFSEPSTSEAGRCEAIHIVDKQRCIIARRA